LARTFANQGILHRDQNHPEQARKLLTQALQIFTGLQMPRERDQAQRLLSNL